MAQIGINAQMLTVQVTQIAALRSASKTAPDEFKSLFDSFSAAGQASRLSSTDAAKLQTAKSNVSQASERVSTNAANDQQIQSVSKGSTALKDAAVSDKGDTAAEQDAIGISEQDQSEDSLMVTVICTIMVQFAQILEVTTDELMGNFEQLDLDPRDIVNGSGIGQLVMSMNNANDMSELLMNTDLSDLVSELTDAVNEVIDEFAMNREMFTDILSGEDLKKLMGDVSSKLASITDELAEMTGEAFGIGKSGNGTGLFAQKAMKIDENGEDLKVNEEGAVASEQINEAAAGSGLKASGDEENGNFADEAGKGIGSREERKTDDRHDTAHDSMFDRFVAGMEHAVKNSMETVHGTETINVREIVYQIVDAVKVSLSPEKNSLELQLTPESLGRVQLNVSSKEGVMTAKITTENETARAAVQSQLETLKETINAQGFKVESIEVTVSSFSFADSKNADADRSGETGSDKKKSAAIGISGETETIITENEGVREKAIMDQNGSTVSYVA